VDGAKPRKEGARTVELRKYYGIFRRWLWLIVLGAFVAASVGFVISERLPRIYEATTTLIVGTVTTSANADYNTVLASQQLAKTYSTILVSRNILEAALAELGLKESLTLEALSKNVEARTVRDTQLITLKVSQKDPKLAADLANSIARQLLSQNPATPQGQLGSVQGFVVEQMRRLEKEITSLQQQLEEVESRLKNANPAQGAILASQQTDLQDKLRQALTSYNSLLTFYSASSSNYVSIIEEARPPLQPSSPRVLLNTLLAALAGLALTIGLALIFEYLDDTVKTSEQVTQAVDLPALALVPRMSHQGLNGDSPLLWDGKSMEAEAYRTLRTNIQFSILDKRTKTLVVTSANPREGKTSTLVNLATAMAQAGLRVIVVDCDLRRPTVHQVFRLPNTRGITTLLLDETIRLEDVLRQPPVPNLHVLTSGPLPPNPAELLGSRRMEAILVALKQRADIVLLDTPPCLSLTDAVVLAGRADGTILVAEWGATRMDALVQETATLKQVGATILGVVLNKFRSSRHHAYHYYRYNYGTASKDEHSVRRGFLDRLWGRNGSKHRNRKAETSLPKETR